MTKQNFEEARGPIPGECPPDPIRSEAAWIFEAAKLGLATKEAIVAWADSRSMLLDSPPYWLIDLSTLQSHELPDHALLLESRLATKLPVEFKVSLIAGACLRKSVPLNRALELLFRIWSPGPCPMGERDATPGVSPFDWEPLADLLAEWDMLHLGRDFPDDFVSRCKSAFTDHLARYGDPPSVICHLPSTI